MKLHMMTHGDPHQYEESSENLISMYQSHSTSPYYQMAGPYAAQSYLGKYYSPPITESPYDNQATTEVMNHHTAISESQLTISNDELLRVAEEQLRPLIKEELRHTIQCKRVAKGLPSHVEIEYKLPRSEPQTPAMVVKRQRRRNRNKVAAAKCRFKKKIISEKLIEESEQLESQNHKLKTEVQRLQEERQKLMYILNLHRPTCIVRSPSCSSPPHGSTSDPHSAASSPGYSQFHSAESANFRQRLSSSSRSSSIEDELIGSITSTFTHSPYNSTNYIAHSPVHRSVIVRSDSVQGSS